MLTTHIEVDRNPVVKDFTKPQRESGALGAKTLAFQTLPVIDIGPLFSTDVKAQWTVVDAIGDAARNIGFFYIKNHTISEITIRSVYAQAQDFFALPQAQKLRYYIGNSRNHRGFVPQSERGDYADEQGERHYEAFDLALDLPPDDPDYVNGNHLLGPNVWPALKDFKTIVSGYYNTVAALGRVMCRAFELYLKLPPGYLEAFMTKPTSQLRLIHYLENNAPMDEKNMNMGAHTDYECFTILHQSRSGLQVMNTANEWIEAPPIPGTFVVNIGDMLETWTNGLFKSTLHRVVNDGKERFSLPFFVAADYDAQIQPLATVISEDNPARYEKIIAGHHLLGQLLRDFSYLKRRYEKGLLNLSFDAPPCNPFEQRPQTHASMH